MSQNALSIHTTTPSVLMGKPRQSVFKQLLTAEAGATAGAAWFQSPQCEPCRGDGAGLALPGKPGWQPPE